MDWGKVLNIRVILAFFLLLTTFGASQGALEWDEGSFLMNAEFFSGTDINFENSRPALISLLVSGIWFFTGESTLAARTLVIVFGAAAVYVFYRLADQEFKDPETLTAFFAFSPLMLYWSWHVYTDVPALLLVLSSLYMFRDEKHFRAGFLVALAAVFRYIFLVIGIGMGIGYLVDRREELLDFVSGSAAGSLPLLGFSYIWFGNAVAKIYLYAFRAFKWSGSGLFSATAGSLESGLYMLSALIPASYTGWEQTSTVEKSMLASYTAFILLVVGNSYQRYWLPAIPFLLLMSYRGLEKKKFVALAALALVISGHGVYTDMMLQHECQQPLRDAVDYLEDRKGIVVSQESAITAYLLDRKVNSRWATLEHLSDVEGAEYAILSTEEPYRRMKSFSSDCVTYHVYDLGQGRT